MARSVRCGIRNENGANTIAASNSGVAPVVDGLYVGREMFATKLHFVSLEPVHAATVVEWRYPPPFEIYNTEFAERKAATRDLLRPENNYVAVLNERAQMIAFRCYGLDAQVPGGDYSADALDLGGGLRPDLTGQGIGRHILAAAMVYAVRRFHPRRFRTTVARFNLRARKLCARLDYRVASTFTRESDGLVFDVLMQTAQMPPMSIPLVEGTPDHTAEPPSPSLGGSS